MTRFAPIAIVGQGCVLPGAVTPSAFWENVLAGVDGVSDVAPGRWRVDPKLVEGSPEASVDGTYSRVGGYVSGFEDVFDAGGFDLPASSLEPLDPLFHWVLHASRAALLDAGLGSPLGDGGGIGSGSGKRGGVILGNLSFPSEALSRFGESVFLEEHARHLFDGRAAALLGLERPDARNRFMSGLPAHLAARALRLEAGGFCLDAACASSLYAIRLAADWLHEGRADVMLAGAVNRADSLFLHVGFCALQAMSPTGRSRPFHKGADGLVPAEGAGVVALMRLDDALREGRRVLGVIRGVGLSNDGRGKNLLAPSSAGQVRAMRAAYEMAGVAPDAVSLVECHATGTTVGDKTELASMSEVFAGVRAPVRIGSLKSNLGHLITAAGAAGLLKVLGALAYKRVPPTLHCDDPADALVASRAVCRVVTEAEDWLHDDDTARVAAVSAFGFGGNNAHLIVEEHREERTSAPLLSSTRAPSAALEAPPDRIAIVGIGARVAGLDREGFRRALLESAPPLATGDATFDAAGVRFPPNDLKAALPQQVLSFEAAREAVSDYGKDISGPRTGVLLGMGCDVDVTSPGVRWRAREWTRRWSDAAGLALDDEAQLAWARALGDAASPVVTAQGVLGQMPNIPANRLNVQLDVTGPGLTVSAEELSGTVALECARSWLRTGELDAVLVGAVDVCHDSRHLQAVQAVSAGIPPRPLDAAVVLVVKRLADAERDHDHIYAIVEPSASGSAGGPDCLSMSAPALDDEASHDGVDLADTLGHSHAASSLLHVAAAALSLDSRALPSTPSSAAQPWLTSGALPSARVHAGGLGGARATLALSSSSSSSARGTGRPVVLALSARDRAALLDAGKALLVDATDNPRALGDAPVRLSVVGRDLTDAKARLQLALERVASGAHDVGAAAFLGEGAPVSHEQVALVFGGAAGPYPGMGRSLLLAFPEVTATLQHKVGDLARAFGTDWLFPRSSTGSAADVPYLDQLLAASCLSQAHAVFTRDVLKVRASHAIGYSLGESNALFALGAWTSLGSMLDDVTASSLFSRDVAGRFEAVRTWLRELGHADLAERERVFTSWTLLASVDDVKRAVADEPLAFVTVINTPREVVIGGFPEACERVRQALRCPSLPNPSAPAVHCAALAPVADRYRALHRRPTTAVDGVRFYGHAHLSSYEVADDACADAILGQALATVDFPALIRRAYDDGVRVFVDHGPRGMCAAWIRSILEDQPHVALALDAFGRPSSEQAADVAAALFAAGVTVDLSALAPRPDVTTTPKLEIRMPALRPLLDVPPPPGARPTSANAEAAGPRQLMALAPTLPSGKTTAFGLPAAERALPGRSAESRAPTPSSTEAHTFTLLQSTSSRVWAALAGARQDMASAHQAFLDSQGRAHATFLETRAAQARTFGTGLRAAARSTPPFVTPMIAQPSAASLKVPSPPSAEARPAAAAMAPRPTSPITAVAAAAPTKPLFDRHDLERLASGRISEVLGPLFSRQDNFPRQVRMPEPPLLLCDRVLAIDAEPGVLSTDKTIWTETDVRWDSWYLHHGRIPPGVLIEAGQADLLLISWMGVDFENQGERVYRLLGCDLTYFGELPPAGTTLHYDIHIDSFATHGNTRLFFFHSDARLGGPEGDVVLSVRNGQAGFFTDEELADSGGCLWEPSDVAVASLAGRPLAEPAQQTTKRAFSREELEAFTRGDVVACFGEGFERSLTHVRTPAPQGGGMLLLDRVSELDPRGGPWGRGYLRAELDFTPDRWFFDGHFKDDPCMPGTLMFEGCLQAMSFYLSSQGFTLEHDGWRFEPVKGAQFKLRCRGQAIPSSKHMTYELFIKEVVAGPRPRVTADILVTIDGLKSLFCDEVGLELVPDYPLYGDGALLGEAPRESGWDAVGGIGRDDNGVVFGQRSLLATGTGKPSDAYGDLYADFDYTRRLARLPGPPYHFLSRVRSIEGDAAGNMNAGNVVVVEYDVPSDAWFFHQGTDAAMPFAVLLEVALQPCGWLSSYVGSMRSEKDLYYRNLDGKGRVHRTVLPDVGTLTTTVRMTSMSASGGLIIQQFTYEVRDAGGAVFDGETTFGFFPPEALARQVGLGASDAEKARLVETCPALPNGTTLPMDLRAQPASFFEGSLRLPEPMLLMIDRVTGLWPEGGSQGLGFVRAEKDVNPREWFFKAHFFDDPVQPGSLGVEAMLQAMQVFVLERGLAEGLERPVFEPLATGEDLVWRYRGQVVPTREKIVIEVDVLEVQRREGAVDVTAQAWLWCDGLRIYHAPKLTIRARSTR